MTWNKQREVTFEDIAKFLEKRARALNHPVFGNLNSDVKSKGRDNRNRSRNAGTFGTCGKERKNADDNIKKASTDEVYRVKTRPKCHLYEGSHWLTRCCDFKRLTAKQRLSFVHKKDVCENCLQPGYKVHFCPKSKLQDFQLSRQALDIPRPQNSFSQRIYQQKSKYRKRHERCREGQ